MNRKVVTLLLAGLFTSPAWSVELVRYADENGVIKTAQVLSVRKDEEKEFNALVLIGPRKRTLKIPSRRVVRFRRGDTDAKNAWATQLARGKRFMASGNLANQGTQPGAEETFVKVAYSKEEGIKGQEDLFAAEPWHNMYATYYLIETRYMMGKAGMKDRFDLALANINEFKKRSVRKKEISMNIPKEGGIEKKSIYCWGSSRLLPQVLLVEAKIYAAMGRKDDGIRAFGELIEEAKKKGYSPTILAEAFVAKATLEADGQKSEQKEQAFRAAGTLMAGVARNQPDLYGKNVINTASNQALLEGADFLLESAATGAVSSWDVPLSRYEQLRDGEGARDKSLYFGAQTGVGVCLTEKGDGERGYKALLDVIVNGAEYPDQMARALYYMGRAAKKFGDELNEAGGKGEFLHTESKRWWHDLRERYPSSEWAKKTQDK